MLLCGRFRGHIQNSALYWHPARMMDAFLSGRNKITHGHGLKSTMCIRHQVHSSYYYHENWRGFDSLVINFITVNSVAWAPHELGAMLACASSDGKISVLEYKGTA